MIYTGSRETDMLSDNKFKYVVFTLALVGLFCLYQTNKHNATDDIACTGTLKKNAFLLDESEAILDTTIFILVGKGNAGISNYNGAVTHDGKRYKINRSINFDYSHEEGSSIYRFVWHDMHLTDEDTLPPELDFIIHSTETQSYFRLSKLETNTMTVNKNGFPLFACAFK